MCQGYKRQRILAKDRKLYAKKNKMKVLEPKNMKHKLIIQWMDLIAD